MSRKTALLAVSIVMVLSAGNASAGGNVLYIHGARMNTWPTVARLNTSSAWTPRTLSFDGSARLQDTTVKTIVNNALDSYCKTTDCVVACYSAGCARLLLALYEKRATTYRILWTEAIG